MIDDTRALTIEGARFSGDGNWGWPGKIVLRVRADDGEIYEVAVTISGIRKMDGRNFYHPG